MFYSFFSRGTKAFFKKPRKSSFSKLFFLQVRQTLSWRVGDEDERYALECEASSDSGDWGDTSAEATVRVSEEGDTSSGSDRDGGGDVSGK